jgi:hypothetical protein
VWSLPWRRSSEASPDLGAVFVAHHADALGHVLGILSGARPRFRDGCFLYVAKGGLARLVLTRRGFSAITFGHVIVAAREPTAAIWRHELRHVAQYERIGLAFLPLYLWFHFTRGYARHPLERDASEAPRLIS